LKSSIRHMTYNLLLLVINEHLSRCALIMLQRLAAILGVYGLISWGEGISRYNLKFSFLFFTAYYCLRPVNSKFTDPKT